MKTFSAEKLRTKIQQKGMSTLALERKAGLKRNAIHNILQGKSKKPHQDTIDAICQVLDCDPEDLLRNYADLDILEHINLDHIVNRTLFLNCAKKISQFLDDMDLDVSFKEYLNLIQHVYDYSIENNLGDSVDKNFINWFVRKNLNIK